MSELKPRIKENGIDYPCWRLLHPGLEVAGGTPPHRKVRTDAPGIFKRSPPSQIEYIDTDRRIVDISCRPERTGTGTVRHYQQMEWVQRCNNIHNRAEEIVLHDIIYSYGSN